MELTVNGKVHTLAVADDVPLLYVLRNDVKCKSVKYGCGSGDCGSCTVLADGQPIRSCEVLAGTMTGKRLSTLEGLAHDGQLDPLQEAFIAEQAIQCGYCVSGILLAARALLNRNPSPSEAEICEALANHLCRCGTHLRMVRAVQRAAGQGGVA